MLKVTLSTIRRTGSNKLVYVQNTMTNNKLLQCCMPRTIIWSAGWMLLVPLRASFLSCFILLGCPAPGAILVTRVVCGWRRSGQAWSSRRRTPGSLLTLVLRPTPHNIISPHISPSPRATCPQRLICTGSFKHGSNVATWSSQHQLESQNILSILDIWKV